MFSVSSDFPVAASRGPLGVCRLQDENQIYRFLLSLQFKVLQQVHFHTTQYPRDGRIHVLGKIWDSKCNMTDKIACPSKVGVYAAVLCSATVDVS